MLLWRAKQQQGQGHDELWRMREQQWQGENEQQQEEERFESKKEKRDRKSVV